MAENEKRRISQLEEQLSNTLRAVDKLHLDVEAFKDYAVENNKVVNGMLKKMDERGEMMLKIQERLEKNDKKWDEQNKKWNEQNKKWNEQNKKWDEQNKKWDEQNKKWDENQANINLLIQEMIRLRQG